MITVLYLNPSAALGGAEWSLLGLVTQLPQTQFHPLVVVPHPGPLVEELHRAGIPSVCIYPGKWALLLSRERPILSLAVSPLALLGLCRAVGQLVRLVHKHKEETLLIHTNGIKAHLLGCAVGWWTRRPVVCHVRDFLGNHWVERWITGWIRRMATAVIVPSKAVAESLMRMDPRLYPLLTVVPNGIDPEQVKPQPSGSSNGSACRVGIVGPLTPRKGQEIFLQAAKQVLQEIHSVQFFIVGAEIYETWDKRGFQHQLEQLANTLGLTPHVIFTGFVRDPIGWMQGFDVIVSASVKPEGFGRVLLEAMALAKPVIATTVGAHPEVVEDETTGLLVPPGNPEAIAQALCRLLKDPDLRQRMGRAGRERAERQFSLLRHVQSIERIYRNFLGGPACSL